MKKSVISILLVLVMASALLAGCSNTATKTGTETDKAAPTEDVKTTDEAEGKSGLIGVSLPAADHGWMAGTIFYAQEKVKELGLTEGTGYKILTSDSVNDQANDIDELISLGCSSIVLLPHNDEVSVAAKKIMDAGINLVVFDRKVSGDYTAYVAGNNAAIGTLGAKYIGEALSGKGTVAVMSAPSVGSVSIERTDAFKAEMQATYPDVKLIEVTAGGFTQEAGLTMATDMLVANPQIDAVFSIDDEPSLGILQAIKEAGRTDIKYISGGGGAQSWYAKIQSEENIKCFTETYSPSMIGDAVALAYDIQQGKEYQKDTIIEPSTVDSDNVAEFINENSPY
ncbi:MAG: LacI family transcriptional regulator [Anaerocolumna sp.]|jgi:ribose transport system substrate-binding protein|nr:LacI family transcriptional regulator [Anaerocolumna sp.]